MMDSRAATASSEAMPHRSRNFATFYQTSSYAQFPQEHRFDAISGLRCFIVDQQPHNFTDAACPDWVLGLPLQAGCPTRFDFGDGWQRARRGRGDCLLVPPHTQVRYEVSGPTRLLVVTWPEGSLAALHPEIFEDEQARLGGMVSRYFKNVAVESICRAIWLELARNDPASRLLLDTALAQLAAALMRCESRQREGNRVSRAELRRSIAFIEDNLTADLSLAEVAAASGLSVFHFSRLFRSEIGRSPYRFIQDRRLALANSLIAKGNKSLEEVASAAGFGNVRRMREARRKQIA